MVNGINDAESFVYRWAVSYIAAGHFKNERIIACGTPEFNAKLAKLHWLSWPVIAGPSMAMMMIALWQLLKGVETLTGLTVDDVFRTEKK